MVAALGSRVHRPGLAGRSPIGFGSAGMEVFFLRARLACSGSMCGAETAFRRRRGKSAELRDGDASEARARRVRLRSQSGTGLALVLGVGRLGQDVASTFRLDGYDTARVAAATSTRGPAFDKPVHNSIDRHVLERIHGAGSRAAGHGRVLCGFGSPATLW